MLTSSSDYGDEIKPIILDIYSSYSEEKKKELYNKISSGIDVNDIIQKYQTQQQSTPTN